MENILLIDDDLTELIRIRKFLAEKGYSVLIADNNQQVFNILREKEIFLILAAENGKNINGLSIINYIKKTELSTEILLITGQGQGRFQDEFVQNDIRLSICRICNIQADVVN